MRKSVLLSLVLGAGIGVPLLQAESARREEGNLVIEEIPKIPQRIIERMRQYQNARSASFEDWDPAGTGMLISTRFGETSQIHYVAEPGGTRRQLTFFDEPIGNAHVCPNPSNRVFLFTKDIGGGEFYQIFEFDLENSSHRLLTDGQSRNGYVLWNKNGNKFAHYSTKRNGRDWDIYIREAARATQSQSVLAREGTWAPADWAPNDERMLVVNYVSANESYYHILDTKTGNLQQLNPKEEKIAYGPGRWSKDGNGIFLTSDEDSEFKRLRFYDVSAKRFTNLTSDIPWDVEDLDISNDGKLLAFTTNENGFGRLYLMNTATRKYERVRGIPMGQIYGLKFHPDSQRLAIVINTPQTPGDTYVLDTTTKGLTRWTYSEVGGLDTTKFVLPELIEYETFDRLDGGAPRKIPAFVFKPARAKKPYPVLIYIHGGPEGQYVPYFSSTFQYWINELGIAVIAPNVRGSDGYGKTYIKLDNGYQREDSVQDIGKLLDWIEKQSDLDESRIGVYGGSYGGYMVLSSMTHYNDRLKCGVDIVGISNFVTFLENTKDYRRDLRRVEYGDERDPKMRAFLEKISPTNNVHKITKPMFIAQGLNDPRVPVGESEQIVSAIRKNGGTVWYLLAKNEGHGFRKKANRDYYYRAVALFLEEHLLK